MKRVKIPRPGGYCYNPPLMSMFELGEQPYTPADAEWDAFVLAHPQGSVLQTTAWARLKSRFGWSPQRVWVREEGQLVAGAQMLIKSAGFGIVRMGYIPHGPLVNWHNPEEVKTTLHHINLAAYYNRAGLVKMEPLLWQDEFGADNWQQLCQTYQMKTDTDTIQPPRTVTIDLRPGLEEILANMRQKTRYNIRLAEKKEVVVRQGTEADVPLFTQMMKTTGQRNEFGVHVPRYYLDAFVQFNLCLPGRVALFLAEYAGQPLAGVMVFAIGRQASYLYGASSNEERQRMPTYAVQWAAMQWAKAQGCEFYDLWGVPDEDEAQLEEHFESRDDGLWGVYRFKRGFGGAVRRTVGPADLPYNWLTYKLYQWRRQK